MPRLGWARSSRGLRCPLVSRAVAGIAGGPPQRERLCLPAPSVLRRGPGLPVPGRWGAGAERSAEEGAGEGLAGGTTRFPLALPHP